MAPSAKKKLSLPSSLLRELDTQQPPSQAKGGGRSGQQLSRKDQRKAQRIQKKESRRPQSQSRPQHRTPQVQPQQARLSSAPRRYAQEQHEDDEDEDEDEGLDEQGSEDDFGLGSESEGDDSADFDHDDEEKPAQSQPSKSERRQLGQDDADIAALEKKLGLKGRKSLPKSFDDDGLGDLLDGLDDDEAEAAAPSKGKRKAEADEWLAQKRRKAEAAASLLATDDQEDAFDSESQSEMGDDQLDDETGDSDGEPDSDESDDGFDGFSEDEEVEPVKPQRENPYVAPTTGVAKYVPPSLRKQSGSNNQVEAQLQRRIQGLINRLTNDNMIGIIKDFTALYDTNPRQTVTSTLVDLVLALVCSPEKRPDAFFTMIAGFIAAVHKAMGMAVSAYFVQQLVELFGKHYEAASGDHSDAGSRHLMSLLAELYNMQVVGCNLVFDYVRLFLGSLSELNTELLLRIIQLCGPSLRRDDPRALGDIVNRVKPADLKNASVRTSFMVDEMKKLQSNKTKAVNRNRDLADQRSRIRKGIATLGGTQDVQSLRIGLTDIQESDKHGKWWLVGASWSGNHGATNDDGKGQVQAKDDEMDQMLKVEDDLGIPDLWQLAREQGFNTEVRQQIFVALHAATDYENADILIRKLRLNKHQRKEVPEVIIRSGERQSQYNHYYTLVASRFTGDKELGFQFRRCLTTRFRKMGEDIDTGDGEDLDADDDAAEYDLRWVYNTAKMYGSLVASQSVRLVDMVKYRNLAALQEKAHMFIEVMFLTILQECKRDGLKKVFGGLDQAVARGVQYFLKKYVRKTDLLKDKTEKKAVKKSCDAVGDILTAAVVAEAGQ